MRTLRGELLELSEAVGVAHPALVDADDIELLDGDDHAVSLRERYGYLPGWGMPSAVDRAAIVAEMASAHPEADERIPIHADRTTQQTDQAEHTGQPEPTDEEP